MQDLMDRHALVCGSTQGIGLACAVELARRGAGVTLVARDAERLASTLLDLDKSVGQAHHTLCADFADPDALSDLVHRHLQSRGPIEILINNTGGPPGGPIVAASPDAFRQAFTQHVVCNQLLVQALLPGMRDRGYGRIINIISTSVKQPIPGLGVSNTIRGAVASWAKTLAGELGPLGITVNNVLPGFTDTARLRSLIASRAESSGQTERQVLADMIATIPLGRLAQPEEIAAAVGFLASPSGGYISGINLPVDGGRTSSL